ncbi:MAG: protein kinase [Candidatus Melainabacteria bacterium]|nr:protein kinase [Candidatus Melainabacteria bacterium]
MKQIDLSSSFEEVVYSVNAQFEPGSMQSGIARNAVIEMWGQLVGKNRAIREIDETIAKYGSISRTAKALAARPETIKRFRAFFEALPDEPDAHIRYRLGDQVGPWRLREKLGRGGNAEVWKATKNDATIGAIKLCLANSYRTNTLTRFTSEIEALSRLKDLPGVIPIIDYYLPSRYDKQDIPWLVMPMAEQFPKVMEEANDLVKFVAFSSIAKTMAIVHDRSISHRDLKPENLFYLNGQWCIGDFGIASFPEKVALTKDRQKLGPAFYLAPEMLNNAGSADGKKADVYSLAKTIWVTLTEMRNPLPGTLWQNEEVTKLTTYSFGSASHQIEPMLEACTLNDPTKRPDMADLAKELEYCVRRRFE